MNLTGSVLGICFLLSSCGENTDAPADTGELESADAASGVTSPDNQTCKVELHDPALGTILDESVELEVLAEGFEIAEGPVWVSSIKTLLFSDVKGLSLIHI